MGSDYMRDLLKKFSETKRPFEQELSLKTPKSEEIELELNLSLGGSFGGESKGKHSLYRSSSSSNASFTSFMSKDVEFSLTRTSSLPLETMEESRKRKGLQSVRHMEALKRRSSLPSSQGSIGSQGSGSSVISFMDNQSAQGSNNNNGSRSPASVLSLPEQMEQKPMVIPCPKPNRKLDITTESRMKNPLEKPKVLISCSREPETKVVMEEMPCVFTKGSGPDGKRIEGLLFKYGKGQEVRIVCVCHGTFLSPAEFVKHAGGGDVAHPLRHIVVVPSPSSFL